MACVQNPRRLAILCGVVSVLSVIIGIAFIIVGPIKEKGFDEAHPCDDHCILRKTSSHYEVNECQGTGCCVGNDTSVKGSCNNIVNTYRQIHTAGIVLVSIVGVVTALTAVSIWYLGRRLTDPSSPRHRKRKHSDGEEELQVFGLHYYNMPLDVTRPDDEVDPLAWTPDQTEEEGRNAEHHHNHLTDLVG
eukprot:TRINITY_DN14079_c0_g1_i1.p1 TRINITY_DN14079_c0_g1~~TRINITY_DN14079_c0_g1_i1.p1  ORF type:complete len:190 (+),score=36.54 TRINITY_DN14079_c0_g1_i1:28-597(+)